MTFLPSADFKVDAKNIWNIDQCEPTYWICSGSNGVFGWGLVLLLWRGKVLLRRGRTNGVGWETVRWGWQPLWRKWRSTRWETRREHGSWRWRHPHWRGQKKKLLLKTIFLTNMTKAISYLVLWEDPQDLWEGKTQVVVVHRGPCEERDHPWGRAEVLEAVGRPSVDPLQVNAEDTHTNTQERSGVKQPNSRFQNFMDRLSQNYLWNFDIYIMFLISLIKHKRSIIIT